MFATENLSSGTTAPDPWSEWGSPPMNTVLGWSEWGQPPRAGTEGWSEWGAPPKGLADGGLTLTQAGTDWHEWTSPPVSLTPLSAANGDWPW